MKETHPTPKEPAAPLTWERRALSVAKDLKATTRKVESQGLARAISRELSMRVFAELQMGSIEESARQFDRFVAVCHEGGLIKNGSDLLKSMRAMHALFAEKGLYK